jgi:hypothetical protein
MTRMLAPLFVVSATPALAHQGLHLHPHGIEFGWLVAALIGAVGGSLISRFRGRK